MDAGLAILLICLLSASSMFFSLNQIALRTFSNIKLQDALKSRNKEALFEKIVENAEKMVLTCSFFRILSNIGFLLVLILALSDKSLGLTFLLAGILYIIFSLVIPHSWAKFTGETVIAATYRVLVLFAWLLTPVLSVFSLHNELVRRLAGVGESTPDQAQEEKQEEIMSVVEKGCAEGVVDEEEVEMIEKVFELGDTTAEEIMTPRTDVKAVNVKDNLHVVLETIKNAGHSRIPVYEDNIDNIIGLVYAKDLLTEIGSQTQDFNLKDKLRKPYFVPETKSLRDLLHEFQNQKLHIAIVLDEYGGTAGIVTIEDILEELVGEITDEYEETPRESLKKINDTTVEIDARMYIDDLNEEFEVNLPEDEDYDTAGGFVFSHLGYIPKTGESFKYENLRFSITAAETRKIISIRIEKLLPEKEEHQ